ncbi:MAG: IPT/TIG domain-containing protein [Bacteroidales bacterium]|nr:IPT/TIG domain-containing protein [Bacteroidales bacterium]
MKSTIKHIIGIVGAVILAGSSVSCDRYDYPDRFRATEGLPTIDYVRYADRDVFIDQAFMDEILCIVGTNLTSVHDIYFNDQKAIINTSYITDKTLVVSVPSTQATEVTNKLYLLNKDGQSVDYDFKVLPPVPKVLSMSNEWAVPGEEVTITGKYFMDVQSVSLPGAEVTDFTVNDSENITFKVPEGATPGPVSVTTASGSANSTFQYLDQRNMLFDFDGLRGGFAIGNGWRAPANGHLHNPGDDAFPALDGTYLWLGVTDPTSNWAEDEYSFDYWNSEDPSSSIPPLRTLPAFSAYINKFGIGGLCLKFECYIPSSNPWTGASMQLMFSSSAVVSNDNMNNTYFSEESVPRALWTPWQATGSYDTGDRWLTISVPLSEFTMTPDGRACATKFDASWLDGFALFVWNGFSGTACEPIIAIDHIRVVPM